MSMVEKLSSLLLLNFVTYRLVWRPLANAYVRLGKLGVRFS